MIGWKIYHNGLEKYRGAQGRWTKRGKVYTYPNHVTLALNWLLKLEYRWMTKEDLQIIEYNTGLTTSYTVEE